MTFNSTKLAEAIAEVNNTKPLHVAVISDIHLGHPNTPASYIVNNLEIAFADNAETARLDIIWFAGDVFDRLLNLSDDRAIPIRMWIARFLRLCAKHSIKVRVLEGTPSHDWKQSRLFQTINDAAQIGCDLVYQEKLAIEYFSDLGISVLYVPDEYRPEPDETWQEVCALLAQHGLREVDYAIMHGAFPHQLPAMAHHGCHDPVRYLSIVRKYIFIGHVHQQSQYERILAQGSFDRLNHGDEGDKGHYRLIDNRGVVDDIITHVKNENALLYVTIDMRGLSMDEVFKKLDSLPNYPVGTHLRVHCARHDVANNAYNTFRKDYPIYYWSVKTEKVTLTAPEVKNALENRFQPTTITPNNVIDLLAPRIRALANSSEIELRCLELLRRGIDNGSPRS
jgi:DNA repair exonuclease SbcCD nuclease subunit